MRKFLNVVGVILWILGLAGFIFFLNGDSMPFSFIGEEAQANINNVFIGWGWEKFTIVDLGLIIGLVGYTLGVACILISYAKYKKENESRMFFTKKSDLAAKKSEKAAEKAAKVAKAEAKEEAKVEAKEAKAEAKAAKKAAKTEAKAVDNPVTIAFAKTESSEDKLNSIFHK